MRSVSAICASDANAGWQHVNISRKRSSGISLSAALATSGVIAVLTGVDADKDGVQPVGHNPLPANPYEAMIRESDVVFVAPHPPMPADSVRFVGEIVAMVIAETPGAARDGAERVVVDSTPLPAVTASLAAASDKAPILYDEEERP